MKVLDTKPLAKLWKSHNPAALKWGTAWLFNHRTLVVNVRCVSLVSTSTVWEVVVQVSGISSEKRVASATYAQYMHKMEDMLFPIPDGVSYEHAGMACCGLGPTFGAMEQMQVNSLDTVMVTGLGPVGLGGIINAHYRGARVIGVESHPYRAELAKKLGAEAVLNPNDEDILDQIRDLTDGVGIDKALDCSGASAAHRLMVDAARRKGQVTFVGEGGEFPLAASRDMIRKGLVLRGNWHYNLGVYPKLMQVIQKSPEVLDTFITHTFPMRDVQKAWELQATGECGKVILHPWE